MSAALSEKIKKNISEHILKLLIQDIMTITTV